MNETPFVPPRPPTESPGTSASTAHVCRRLLVLLPVAQSSLVRLRVCRLALADGSAIGRNMRAKLVPASPAAEALYLHLLSLPAGAVGDNELRIAHRKLDALREERATAAWQPTFDVETVDEEEEEAARSAWLSATVLRAHELGGGDEMDNASRGGGAEETAGGHEGEGEVTLMAESMALDYRRSAGGQLHAGHDASAAVLASRRDWFAAPAADEENIDLENVTSRRRDFGL